MLRALLEERFHLKRRRETREMPVLALVVAKSGSKLTSTAATSTDVVMRTVQGSWNLKNVGMDRLADRLSRQLGRTVIDRTVLQGRYDIRLDWTRDEGAGDASPPADPNRASLFTAPRSNSV